MTSHLIRLNVKKHQKQCFLGKINKERIIFKKKYELKKFRDGGIFVGRSGQVKQT